MNDPFPTPSSESADAPEYKFEIGDKLSIPGHNGHYVCLVVHRYPDLETAVDQYERSFRSILQSPRGKPKPNQPFYYCEVDNSTHKALGVAESAATLKQAAPSDDDED